MRRSAFISTELIVVLSVLLVIVGGIIASGLFSKKNVFALLKTFDAVATAQTAMNSDTGYYAGESDAVPFPDALLNPSSITDSTIRQRWRGPYLKTVPTCPYANCAIDVDFTTGAATNPGEIYQYFITATNVPLEDALELSRKENGDSRVSECTESNIANVVTGSQKPCAVYLSTTTGGRNTKVTVYYTFASGTY